MTKTNQSNNYSVYVHRNKTNGKVYVGITAVAPEKRWKSGWGYYCQPMFWNAIQKYGWDDFEHFVVATGLTREEACKKEVELISEHNSNNRDYGYNRDLGGYANRKMSEESKQLLREKNLGKKMSEESRRKMGDVRRGKPLSEEHKKKISAAQLGRPVSELTRETNRLRMTGNTIWLGRHHTEETKEAIRQKHLGREFSDEWRARLSENRKGKLTGRDNPISKSVLCVETGAVFSTITEAAKTMHAGRTRIKECCLGQRETSGGYHWEFATAEGE